jgi:SOS-response transcriptional repressor LexA
LQAAVADLEIQLAEHRPVLTFLDYDRAGLCDHGPACFLMHVGGENHVDSGIFLGEPDVVRQTQFGSYDEQVDLLDVA